MNHLQLTLGLSIRDDATFANYFNGNNANLIQALKNCVLRKGERFIYIWGSQGVGRSHLLQACCHEASEKDQSIAYLPLAENKKLTPDVLDSLENLDMVCIDDIDAVLSDALWAEALFHFYNRMQTHQTRLIVSAMTPAQQLNHCLPDLQSRLASGLCFQVQALNDDQIILALQMRAIHRGLQLSRDVGQYLVRHYPRNMGRLFDVLIKLDQASLIAQRRLTIPFVKQVLDAEV